MELNVENPNRILQSRRVVIGDQIRPAALYLKQGVIAAIEPYIDEPDSSVEDFGDLVIMPGCIDVHVHLNEPGRTEWEGFETGTQAAAAGGITTLVEMPLNSSPTTITLEAYFEKLAISHDKLNVNCAFHAGVVPGNDDELDEMLREGCIAGKAFLIDSGMEDFPWSDVETLRTAMETCHRHHRPIFAHAELDLGQLGPDKPLWTNYFDYLASRTPAMEIEAIKMMIDLCRETGCAVHIVHLSAIEGLALIEAAKGEGLPVTVETAPHYLTFAAEEIPDGRTEYKCAPPIREASNRALLKQAVLDGRIDMVATDHSPSPPEFKQLQSGDFKTAWGGISSLQLLLSATWTALKDDGLSILDLCRLLSTNPAKLLRMRDRGLIGRGKRADLVVWDPEETFEVTESILRHRHKLSPYLGMTLAGQPIETIVGGETAFTNRPPVLKPFQLG